MGWSPVVRKMAVLFFRWLPSEGLLTTCMPSWSG